ncbi:MAG: plastocyanin/azurin family copper-binding protein [Methylophaga sp.]|nr:plastocyanin/azurin family copper-binding protein [Methylophaga sp.]
MIKATSTFSQARNIAMALTMSFAAVTLVTACGNDESSETAQNPEAEMSAENQSNITQDNSSVVPDTEDTMATEPVAEPDTTADTTTEPEETNTSAAANDASTETDVSESEGAKTHEVTAQGLKFEPLVIKINPGDTVAWRNMSTHNSESIDGLIPEGAEKWNSPMSENYERTFTEEGIYIYKCTPHIGAGMGGAIIVGEPVNLEQIKNADASGAAGRLVRKAISEAESM